MGKMATLVMLVVAVAVPSLALPRVGDDPVTDFVTRNNASLLLNGKPFRYGGCNAYWLGIDENCVPPATGECVAYPSFFRIDDALATAAALGHRVVRAHTLGVSSGMASRGLALFPTNASFNDAAFNTIDYAIERAKAYGIRLIVPLTDNWNYYHGSYHDFLRWHGYNCTATDVPSADSPCMKFYTDPAVINTFKAYLTHLLIHVNTATGVALKDEPAILAWETGNELHQGGAPFTNWTAAIAAHLRQTIGAQQLVLDGRAGPSCWPSAPALANEGVDLYSDHYYSGWSTATKELHTDTTAVARSKKVFIVGEYGAATSTAWQISPFLRAMQNDPAMAGDTWWSLFGHGDNYGFVYHSDHFTLHFPEQTPEKQALVLRLREHAYAMQGKTPPAWPTPRTPTITAAVLNENGTTTLAWRGAAFAVNYTVEVSASSQGPWAAACTRCATDYDTPWLDTSGAAATVSVASRFYRAQAFNLDGQAGNWSDVVQASTARPAWFLPAWGD